MNVRIIKSFFDEPLVIRSLYLTLTIKVNVNCRLVETVGGSKVNHIDLNVVVLDMRRVYGDQSVGGLNVLGLYKRILKRDGEDVKYCVLNFLNSYVAPHLNTCFYIKNHTRLFDGTNIGINKITYKRK
jgi:hypothetical protein